MQDAYVGDIGDYGKYGLLRVMEKSGLEIGINWYKVVPRKAGKQNDGKYISYLTAPCEYRHFDPELFDKLSQIVLWEQDRRIERVEQAGLLHAKFYSEPLEKERREWHIKALETLRDVDVVFLDPDNGLETRTMEMRGTATEKHACRREIKDYYCAGKSVVLYQHLPQMTKKEVCIEELVYFGKHVLGADELHILEFPRYTTRFYACFLHYDHAKIMRAGIESMDRNWKGICRRWLL